MITAGYEKYCAVTEVVTSLCERGGRLLYGSTVYLSNVGELDLCGRWECGTVACIIGFWEFGCAYL